MKLLIILNDLDIGGAQNYTISLINEFYELGHEIELRVLSDNIPLKGRLSNEVSVKILNRKRKFDIKVLKAIRKEIKNGNFDGIITSYIIYQRLATLFLTNLPITIYPIHSTIPKSFKIALLNFLIFRKKFRNEIFLSSIDNQTQYLTAKYRLKNDFFQQIYNGVDTVRFTPTPATFDKSEFLESKKILATNKIILMVAGFRKEKRHIDAINAFKLLLERKANVSLVFVGDNRKSEAEKLENYANQVGCGNVHFFTADVVGDIRSFYWSADIFTLTSNQVETFPISSLEAMSSGLPCVLTNIGGASDIIKEGLNGITVEPEDIKSIALGWGKVLDLNTIERKKNIRDYIVENYSIKKSAKEYLDLIRTYAN